MCYVLFQSWSACGNPLSISISMRRIAVLTFLSVCTQMYTLNSEFVAASSSGLHTKKTTHHVHSWTCSPLCPFTICLSGKQQKCSYNGLVNTCIGHADRKFATFGRSNCQKCSFFKVIECGYPHADLFWFLK